MGRKSTAAIARFPEGSRARAALQARWDEPTLWDAFLQYLKREGYDVSSAHLARDVHAPIAPSADLQEVLIRLYRTDPKNSELCERLVDLDEGMQEWRYRHVKMVERTIGGKPGTGGSAGAQYLKSTLSDPAFPDLWAIRAKL
jgi:tryptophan 2,3-dioxygenase